MVVLPAIVEALEAVRAKADAGSGCEVEIAGVEEIEEAILQHFRPNFQVLDGQYDSRGCGQLDVP